MKKHFLPLVAITMMIATTIQAQIPTNGLVAWYPFNGNANDSSGNGNNGTVNGATLTTDRFGNKNSAYSFDGVSNNIYIQHPILSTNPCDSNWTISFWFLMPKNIDSMNQFVVFDNGRTQGQNGFNGFGWLGSSSITKLYGYWYGRAGLYTIDSVYKANTWYNLTYVYTSINSTLKVFVNGIDNSGAIGNTNTGGTASNLGNWYVGSSGYYSTYFNGKIDDIRVYNVALDSTNVQALYHEGGYATTTPTIPTNGLIAWYPFNGNANDSSGNGRNGTVYSANNTVKYVSGQHGQGIYLKGSGHTGTQGDYVILPAIGMNKYPSYTISLWVKQDGDADSLFGHGENFIGGHSLSNSCNGTFAFSYQGHAPAFQFGYGNGHVGGSSIYTVGDLGNWVLHTLVIVSGTAYCYKNGVLFATMAGTTNTDAESEIGVGTHWFCSGGTQSTRFLGGIDDIRIYNRALDSNEIQSLYNEGGNALPVSIENISALQVGKATVIHWYASTKLNTSHFIIQHSTDGSSFTDIGTVKAIGSGVNGYGFTDNNPTTGTNYYRVQSVDKDGSSSYSKVVSCQLTINNYQLSISPNPAKDIVTVKGAHIVSVQVVDNMGKLLKTLVLKDATNPTLSVSGLPAGVYHLRVQTTDGKVSAVGMVKE